jgi:hypothetical protein
MGQSGLKHVGFSGFVVRVVGGVDCSNGCLTLADPFYMNILQHFVLSVIIWAQNNALGNKLYILGCST